MVRWDSYDTIASSPAVSGVPALKGGFGAYSVTTHGECGGDRVTRLDKNQPVGLELEYE